MSKKNKQTFYILLACVLLGFILTRQFFWQKQLKKETQPEQEKELALQVSQLIKSNADLREQLNQLREQDQSLQKKSSDKRATQNSLADTLGQYQDILGTVPVIGNGISLQLSQPLDKAQVTDLINALRNIGAEAIAINGRRITPTTGWNEKTFSPPYLIQATGDSELLKDSLERRGGIMEQINFAGTIKKENELHLPASHN